MADWSLYEFEKDLAGVQRRIAESELPKESKELLRAFDRACLVAGMSAARRLKLLQQMLVIGTKVLPTPLATADLEAIQDAVGWIESHADWSPWTKCDYKVVLKRFFKWFVYRDKWTSEPGYPPQVAWIRPRIKRKDRCCVKASDLLTHDDVIRMINATQNPRNRAFIALLYELGARVSEIGTMHVGDIVRDEYSLLVDVEGKTGKRTVRDVMFASHVVTWLNLHPSRDDLSAPLWPVLRGTRRTKPMQYAALATVVKAAAEAAGIQKRIYPHLFRHSRSTHVLASGGMNEAQAKAFFGWVPDSNMLGTYAHLVTRDANDAVLRMFGIKKSVQHDADVLQCSMCRRVNADDNTFCSFCGYALKQSGVDEIKERTQISGEYVARLLKRPVVQDELRRMLDMERDSLEGILTGARTAQSPAPIQEVSLQRRKVA